MASPYREMPFETRAPQRDLDPWMLALLFAWVCDVGRIGMGLVDRRSIEGELAFAGVLAIVTGVWGMVTWRRRREGSRSLAAASRL